MNNYYDDGKILSLKIFIASILIILLIIVVVMIIQVIANFKIFKKAGKHGWEAIVPFYSNWILVEIAGLKWWWFLIFFASLILSFIKLDKLGFLVYLFGSFNCYFNISKKFNKDLFFAICYTIFPVICASILGFSKKNKYDSNIKVSTYGVFKSNENTFNNTSQNNQNSSPQNFETKKINSNESIKDSRPAFCLNCGNKLNNTDKFCTNCGKQI